MNGRAGEMEKNRRIFSKGVLVLIAVLFFFCNESLAAGSRSRASRLYLDERYEEALEEYERALERRPDDPELMYNKAVVLYRKGKFAEAEEAFIRSAVMSGRSLEAMAAYNAANAKFREGERLERSDPEGAMAKYAEALDYYKRAIDLDTHDLDAKYNYEFLRNRMEQLENLMDEERDHEDRQDPDQDPEDGDQPEPRPRPDRDEDEDEEEPEDEDDTDDKEDPSDPDEGEPEPSDPDDEDPREAEKEPALPDIDSIELGEDRPEAPDEDADWDPDELSSEQVEMILRRQEEEENRVRAEEREKRRDERPPVLKDW